jgi:hypothetical protein
MEKQKISATYAERRTFFPFGDKQIIGFLGETVVENWMQPNAPEDAAPITGYQYEGTRQDGGTLMPCDDPSDYGCVTNAIIRSRYSESEELAIHRHYVNSFEEHQDEWNEYNQFCEEAKVIARRWLGIE